MFLISLSIQIKNQIHPNRELQDLRIFLQLLKINANLTHDQQPRGNVPNPAPATHRRNSYLGRVLAWLDDP
jgi:hypothetical protein